MSIIYSLFKKPVTKQDYARFWLSKGIKEATFETAEGRRIDSGYDNNIKVAVIVAGSYHLKIDEASYCSCAHDKNKSKIDKQILESIIKAAEEFEKAGLKCKIEDRPAIEYAKAELSLMKDNY
jgi:hypothetical protein